MTEPSAESFLAILETIFSNYLLFYFLKETDWQLTIILFISLQIPIIIFWEIIHIIVKQVFKND
jgi:hypothetical protein